MGDVIAAGRGELEANDHFFWLVDHGSLPGASGGPANGLILVTRPGAALVFTGIDSGPAALSVEARAERPVPVDTLPRSRPPECLCARREPPGS